MFSSNQILEISGEMSDLESTLAFVINMDGGSNKSISYQITEDGRYCIGWLDKDGWIKYPFDYDPHIIAAIVCQHLNKNAEKAQNAGEYDWADGSNSNGFLMKAINGSCASEENGIKNPFYGIVSIEPYQNFYAK